MTDLKIVAENDFARATEPQAINFKVDGKPGHPFMIGTQHFPHDGSMYIKPEQAPCAMKGCGRPVEAHTHDRVSFIYLKRNATKTEVQTWLMGLITNSDDAPAVLSTEKCDGFAFVDTGFRVG